MKLTRVNIEHLKTMVRNVPNPNYRKIGKPRISNAKQILIGSLRTLDEILECKHNGKTRAVPALNLLLYYYYSWPCTLLTSPGSLKIQNVINVNYIPKTRRRKIYIASVMHSQSKSVTTATPHETRAAAVCMAVNVNVSMEAKHLNDGEYARINFMLSHRSSE